MTSAVPPLDGVAERAGADTSTWTAAIRRRIEHAVPPGEALPDQQPAYVSSWIYVFGVLTLAALAIVVVSGGVLAIGGATWWHTSSLGLFANSLHLWSVELFFAFMVIHLWGTFWMAAWRGHRTWTWITGVIAFLGSIATAFTGYLSQSNFDSQWISTQAKDGLNSVGIGAWFNVLNPGQMLLWHAALLPFVLGVLAVLHLILVRRHGVVPPLEAEAAGIEVSGASRAGRRRRRARAAPYAATFPKRRYDLVREGVIALVAVSLLTVGLAAVFSSPDENAITMSRWAEAAPNDVVATATGELAGTTTTATYGAPYNHSAEGQKLGPLPLQKWGGVTIPINAANDLVISPLRGVTNDQAVSDAVSTWETATADQRTAWATAYGDALAKAPDGNPAEVASGDYGPVPALATGLLTLARSGGLEGALTQSGTFYGADASKSLLLLADGAYLEDQARARSLGGDQWGMMNETGNYPGQPWMWLYTFWYQIPPFSTSDNADALVWGLMMLLSLGLVLVPFIPGVRSLPRLIPIHRLIWRDFYRDSQPR